MDINNKQDGFFRGDDGALYITAETSGKFQDENFIRNSDGDLIGLSQLLNHFASANCSIWHRQNYTTWKLESDFESLK